MSQGRILNLVVRAYSGGAPSVLMGLSYALSSIAGQGRNAAMALMAAGAVMLAGGGVLLMGAKAAIQAAIDYDTAMRRVATITETTPAGFEMMKDKVLELTRIIPKSATEMANALYFIKSVVVDDVAALKILEISSKAATLALSETEPVAKTLSAAYIAYGGTLQDVSRWSDQLTEAVSLGRAEFEDFATQIGALIGYGGSLGVTFSELSTWMAFMTRRGYSASQSTVFLRNVMLRILKPSADAKKVYQELGVAWGSDAVKGAGGLIPYLQLLGEKTQWNVDTMARLFPNVRALPLLLAMAQDAAKGAQGELGNLAIQIENASGTLEARFAIAMEGAQNKLQIFKNSVKEVAIRLGSELLPILGKIVGAVTPIIQAISIWAEKNPEMASSLMQVIIALGMLLVAGGAITILIGLAEMLWTSFGHIIVAATLMAMALTPVIGFLSKLGVEVRDKTNAMIFLREAWENLVIVGRFFKDMLIAVWEALTGTKAEISTAAEFVGALARSFWILTERLREWAESPAATNFRINVVSAILQAKDAAEEFFGFLSENKETIIKLAQVALALLGFKTVFGLVAGAAGGLSGVFKTVEMALYLVVGWAQGLFGWLGKLGPVLAGFGGKVALAFSAFGMNIGAGSKFLTFLNGFSPALRKVGDVILTFFTRVASGTGIWTALTGALGTASGASIISSLSTAFSSAAAAIGSFLSVIAPLLAVLAAVASVAYVVWKYWDNIKGVFSTTSPFVQGLIDVFQPMIAQIQAQLLPLWNALKELWVTIEPIVTVLGVVIGAILVVALGLLVGIISGVVGALAGLVRMLTGVVQFLSGLVTMMITPFKFLIAYLKGIFTGDWSGIEKAQNDIKKAWGQMWNGLINILGGAWDAISGLVMGLVNGIINFFVGLYESVVGGSIIPDMVNGIINWIAKLPGKVMAIISALVSQFIAQVISLGLKVKAGFDALVNLAIAVLNKLPGQIGNLLRAALNTAIGIAGEFASIGSAITNAIRNAVSNTWSSLVSKLRSLVNLLPAVVKQMLGIRSPSRVFAELGKQIPMGLAAGITGNIVAIQNAMDGMTGSLSPAFTGGFAVSNQQTLVHRVEFGNLPDGVKMDFTAQEVADLIMGDEKSLKQVARKVDLVIKKDIR